MKERHRLLHLRRLIDEAPKKMQRSLVKRTRFIGRWFGHDRLAELDVNVQLGVTRHETLNQRLLTPVDILPIYNIIGEGAKDTLVFTNPIKDGHRVPGYFREITLAQAAHIKQKYAGRLLVQDVSAGNIITFRFIDNLKSNRIETLADLARLTLRDLSEIECNLLAIILVNDVLLGYGLAGLFKK